MLIDDAAPVDSGYVAYRGTVPVEALAEHGGLREPDGMVIWVGPGLHLVQYPVRRGELVNQVATFDTRRYPSEEDIGRQLERVFERTCAEVAHGVALMDHTRRWPMLDRAPASGWTRGNITLIGDAAHPMLQYLAQGACQAIEDSVVLADSVAAHPGDVEAAFTAYEALRFPRTARVQTTAHMWGDILHIDGVGATMRSALLSQRTGDDFEIVDWLYGYDPTSISQSKQLTR
jgi:salicylate hydroxylase